MPNRNCLKKILLLLVLCTGNPVLSYAQDATAPKGDLLDNLMAFLIILFILSLISERISNFFKMKLSGTRKRQSKKSKISYYFSFNNTAFKTENPVEEKRREFRVLKINIFFGVIIALAFRADLFQIIDHINEPTAHIGWDSFLKDWPQDQAWEPWQQIGYRFISILVTFIGCGLVGAFLSFGSKFWHDLLDLILQVKDYKRMLTQEGVIPPDKALARLDTKEQDVIISAAIRENYELWKTKYPNINGCVAGLKSAEGTTQPTKAVIFYVKTKPDRRELKESEIIPPEILYNGYRIPTDVVSKPIATAQGSIQHPGDNFNPARIGTNISRNILNEYGTVGLKVKREFSGNRTEHYLLSCFHVLYNDRLDKSILQKEHKIQVKTSREDITTSVCIPGILYCNSLVPPAAIRLAAFVKEGIFSNVMDAALAKLQSGDVLENRTFFFDNLRFARINGELLLSDLQEGMLVYAYGSVSGRKGGKIQSLSVDKVDVELSSSNQRFVHTYAHLIQTDAITDSGDSGAPVLSEEGNVVGIIIAGDGIFSYVLPWQFIKNSFFVTL